MSVMLAGGGTAGHIEPALALAEESAAANGLRAKFVKADVFEELERLGAAKETFDIVIADPPPFVKSRKDLEPGAKAYRKLARLAAKLVAPDGLLLLASCSHNILPDRFAAECAHGIARAERRASSRQQISTNPRPTSAIHTSAAIRSAVSE